MILYWKKGWMTLWKKEEYAIEMNQQDLLVLVKLISMAERFEKKGNSW